MLGWTLTALNKGLSKGLAGKSPDTYQICSVQACPIGPRKIHIATIKNVLPFSVPTSQTPHSTDLWPTHTSFILPN